MCRIAQALLSCSVVLAFAATAAAQIPPGYHVIQVTENNYFDFRPKMNDRGQVVFERRYSPHETLSAEIMLYDANSGEMTRLTDDNIWDTGPDISSDGVITWARGLGPIDPNINQPTLEIVTRTPDGVITRLTDNAAHDRGPRVNALGHIVWYRYMQRTCGFTADIFMYDGQSVFPITTNAVPDGVANQSVQLNDRDQITWVEFDFCVSPWESDIMLYDDGVTLRLTDEQHAPAAPDLNNEGVVGWFYRPPTGGNTIQLWQDGVTTDLTDWGTAPVFSESGQIVFHRWHASTGNWQEWLYRDGAFWQLSDDPFWNSTGDINRAGEVAWTSGNTFEANIRLMRRFGVGDLNCDGAVDASDIEPFLLALFDPTGYRVAYPNCDALLGDIDQNGTVDALDFEPFIRLLFP